MSRNGRHGEGTNDCTLVLTKLGRDHGPPTAGGDEVLEEAAPRERDDRDLTRHGDGGLPHPRGSRASVKDLGEDELRLSREDCDRFMFEFA